MNCRRDEIMTMRHVGANQAVEATQALRELKAPENLFEASQVLPGSHRRASSASLSTGPGASPILLALPQPSSPAELVRRSPPVAAAQGAAISRLPQELLIRVFSFLSDAKLKRTQLDYRLVCQSWNDASMCGKSRLKDNVASGYLRGALGRHMGCLTYQDLDPFLQRNLSAIETLDLRKGDISFRADQAELMHRVLEEHAKGVKNLLLESCCGIVELPRDARIYGNLNLRGTTITDLPEGLRVGGTLDLGGSRTKGLPAGLIVGGLELGGSRITRLPERLTVGGNLCLGSLSIFLQEGLTVSGDLDLRRTPITRLPAGLTVGGDLNLTRTSITHLPERLVVHGNLLLTGSSARSWPAGTMGGMNYFGPTPITQLPRGLVVDGSLYLGHTRIAQLPEGFKVGGSLSLRRTPIAHLPEGLMVGRRLDLRETAITRLPAGLTVGGDLDLRHTGITEVPAWVKVGGKIYQAERKTRSLKDGI